jgi:hypothetical protein
VPFRLGIDIACRAAHQVSLANEQGRLIWSGRRFRTTPADLNRLWSSLPGDTDPADVPVVMERTRNAWVPLAAWFRGKGARVVLVPPERSADLRPGDALKRAAKLHSTWFIAAASPWPGWTRCWRSSARPGTRRSARTWPTAPC